MSFLSNLEASASAIMRRAGVKHVEPAVLRAAMVAGALLVLLAVWRWWPAPDPPVASAFGEAGRGQETGRPIRSQAAAEDTETVCVHVVGAVRRPGVYEVRTAGRVLDAVKAAGGMLPDAVPAGINLARLVKDGEQIRIPDEDESQAVAPAGGAAAASPGAGEPVDLNSADASALDALPGVGPATASKIIADRESNGPFATTDDLSRVPGIGEKKLADLEGLICVR